MKSMELLFSVLPLIVALNPVEVQTRKYYCVRPTKYITDSNNESCSTLAVYMLNSEQYFTSNTEVYFKTGDYHLYIALSVTNVTNLSITGDVNVTIWCHNAYILIANSTMVQINNIKFTDCGLSIGNKSKGSMNVHNVVTYGMVNVTLQNSFGYAIIGNNIQGISIFKNVIIFQDSTLNKSMNGILTVVQRNN